MSNLRDFQLQDGTISAVLTAKEENSRPSEDSITQYSTETRRLFQIWDQLVVEEGVLLHLFVSPTGTDPTAKQLVVPKCLHQSILENIHAGATGGHLGQAKTLSKLKMRFYWPGHYRDVQTWCRTCSSCATRKTSTPHQRGNLQPVVVGAPMQLVAIDLLGPFPTSPSGNSYLLVAMDYFTRWGKAYPVPSMEAITVATVLTNEMFFRFSPPERLHLDQGRQFESKLVKELCHVLQVEKSRTSPYHPQGDGLVERYNRTLLDILATSAKSNLND